MANTFDELCATIGKAHSVFDLSHVPLDLMQGGLADAAARIKAIEDRMVLIEKAFTDVKVQYEARLKALEDKFVVVSNTLAKQLSGPPSHSPDGLKP